MDRGSSRFSSPYLENVDYVSTPPDARILLWIAQNRGLMTRMAVDFHVTQQFIAMVLRGQRKSKDGRVERALRAEGAPI